jgi:hypothetical protein
MFTWIDYTFWAAESVAYLAVLFLILRARAWKQWYSVSLYCALQFLISCALCWMLVHHKWRWYFYTQWPSEIAFSLLRLVILWQIILDSIATTRAVPKPIQRIFLFAAIIVAAAAFAFGVGTAGHASDPPSMALAMNRATSFAVIGVFSTFCGFSSLFDMKWKKRGLQIDLGITLIAVVDLLCFLAGTKWRDGAALLSRSQIVLLLYRTQVAFHLLSLFIWSRAFLIPDAPTQPITEELRGVVRRVYQELPPDPHGPTTTEIWR